VFWGDNSRRWRREEEFRRTFELIAGVDEVGRGALAGPVVAAAVILPKDFDHPELNDSKCLRPEQREELYEIIVSEAIAWAVARTPRLTKSGSSRQASRPWQAPLRAFPRGLSWPS